jgi:hypothetical protein
MGGGEGGGRWSGEGVHRAERTRDRLSRSEWGEGEREGGREGGSRGGGGGGRGESRDLGVEAVSGSNVEAAEEVCIFKARDVCG